MPDELEFEKPLLELENRIVELRESGDPLAARDEIAKLEERLARQQQRVYSGLTAWQRTQIARHPKRPHTLDLINLLMEDWIELHGDRVFGDDKAIVGGLATFEGEPVSYDPCYHQPCDNRSNLNLFALDVNADAIATAVITFALDTSTVNGVRAPGKSHGRVPPRGSLS